MPIFGIVIGIIALVAIVCWKVFWAIVRPIFKFLYQGAISLLTKTGMSNLAAKALISLVVLVLLVVVISSW